MFFRQLNEKKHRLAVVDGDSRLTYEELACKCDELSLLLPQKPCLIFLKAKNDISTLVAYLTALRHDHVVMLLDPDIDETKYNDLVSAYRPNVAIEGENLATVSSHIHRFHSDLCLLLSTSGSTGSAKQVCLSQTNLHANAQSICDYLPIDDDDKTITTLPFFYSYGLSIINSHLLKGSCIVFNRHSVVSRDFWQLFKSEEITSFGGVPYSYQMLLKLRFTSMNLPHLRYFTQAGGKLEEAHSKILNQYAIERGISFYIMYGQTEATARMAYLAPAILATKPCAIGKAIPAGRLHIVDSDNKTIVSPNTEGELIYSGPNVMLGYANTYADLLKFTSIEHLYTGDIAYFDNDGDFVICGRKKRFIKLFGQRLNLDEIESLLSQKGLESYCTGDDNKLLVAVKNNNDIKAVKHLLSNDLQLHHSVIQIIGVDSFPITANGKKDYQSVKAMLNG